MNSHIERVYQGNIDGFAKTAQQPGVDAQLTSLMGNDSIGSALYYRLYRYVRVLVKAVPQASWLTVGDGRFGIDGYHLKQMGAAEVQVSDISAVLLDKAVEKGIIPGYTLLNAEQMDMPDEAVDYILCKEALHHFPRPYLGLYEMLRVARQGVVLVEPHDVLNSWPFLREMETTFDKIHHWTGLRLSPYRTRFSYETVGNFVYKISAREMEKVAAGLGLPMIAVRSHNYFWKDGLHTVAKARRWRYMSYWKVALKKGIADLGRYLGCLPGGLLTVIVFKQIPDAATLKSLKKAGFYIVSVKPNPYLH